MGFLQFLRGVIPGGKKLISTAEMLNGLVDSRFAEGPDAIHAIIAINTA